MEVVLECLEREEHSSTEGVVVYLLLELEFLEDMVKKKFIF